MPLGQQESSPNSMTSRTVSWWVVGKDLYRLLEYSSSEMWGFLYWTAGSLRHVPPVILIIHR